MHIMCKQIMYQTSWFFSFSIFLKAICNSIFRVGVGRDIV